MGPPIEVFLTTIASQAALRQKQEYLLRTLQVKKIPYVPFDLASDEDAKKRWRRKAPAGKFELPGLLVGGSYIGPYADFEDAAEHDELTTFLRLNDPWDPLIDEDNPPPPPKPVGVPGAMLPGEMNKDHKPSFAASPAPKPDKKRQEEEFDISTELSGYGLQGVKMTNEELSELAKELGLGDDEAEGLVSDLGGLTIEGGKEKEKEKEKEEVNLVKEEKVESQEGKSEAKPEDLVVSPTKESTTEPPKEIETPAQTTAPSESAGSEVKEEKDADAAEAVKHVA